jgi:hypothetical protein
MISLCLASRNRPQLFKRMCVSAFETASTPANIEFVVYRDDDDPSEYEYVGTHKVIIGKRNLNFSYMLNECYKKISGSIYMVVTDDCVFKTKDWDKKVEAVFDRFQDKIVLVCPDNNDWRRWKIGTMMFMHKNWIETIGFPPTQGQGQDTWFNEIAVSLGRLVRLNDVRIEHNHEDDLIHKEKKQDGLNNSWTKKYYSPESAKLRKRDTELLRKFIEDYNLLYL